MTTMIKIQDEQGNIITTAEIKSAKGISDERLTYMAINAHIVWLMGTVDPAWSGRSDIEDTARANARAGAVTIERGEGE